VSETVPQTVGADSTPFRFYDNRQKYLTFVNTCNEKAVIVKRATLELAQLRPSPPALRMFDAGMGDATVLSRLMRTTHHLFPNVPLVAVAKEISLEDVRLGLEKTASTSTATRCSSSPISATPTPPASRSRTRAWRSTGKS
jgi:hypothetical protein